MVRGVTVDTDPDDPLRRRLGLAGATVIGLGAMLGAGVFGALAPAAAAAGPGLVPALVLAGLIAALNAAASARLAARHPESGGTYVYATRRLGRWWGVCAGWCFVSGKLASCAAMALVFGAYVLPGAPRAAAVAAVVACAVVNHVGVAATMRSTAVILAVVLTALAASVVGGWAGDATDAGNLADPFQAGVAGILEAAGFLFFAFAGYARLATLGGEVRAPTRTIPRAIVIALVTAFTVYAVVAVTAIVAVGAGALASSDQPLVTVAAAGGGDTLQALVRVGAAVACLGVLLSLLAGVGRTGFAMARDGWLPGSLARVHPGARVPRVAGAAAAVVVAVAVMTVDLRGAIGFSSVLVLAYYAIANAAAFTLPPGRARVGRAAAVAGVAGCLLIAVSLPGETFLVAAAVLAAGLALLAVGHAARTRRASP